MNMSSGSIMCFSFINQGLQRFAKQRKGDRFNFDGEWEVIRQSLQRGQLTGSARFVDEIEQKIKKRIEIRGQGRPRSTESNSLVPLKAVRGISRNYCKGEKEQWVYLRSGGFPGIVLGVLPVFLQFALNLREHCGHSCRFPIWCQKMFYGRLPSTSRIVLRGCWLVGQQDYREK
jgi:hypothetical protein